MRCYICDCEDDSISFDRQDGRFSPCKTCQAVVQDTIFSYDDDDTTLIEEE